jgi:FlaA1/EpsC-like NDP-sugar epimerase
VDNVIIAMPSVNHKVRRDVVNFASNLGVSVLTVPAVDDLISGRLNVSKLRAVEVEDLLGRDVVDLDQQGLREMISGQVIFVSGAGGSIGSEICRQIVSYEPRLVICFDISEYALYQLEQQLTPFLGIVKVLWIVGDVKNAQRLKALFIKHSPNMVFHAAAYKHVPLMEKDNVSEALINNVWGTHTLAKLCQEFEVSKFVLISSDKAVNPTNVMGASKRLSEMIIQGLHIRGGTHFVIVRFGNVLGSSGSVIPKFRDQIAAGGPITITHPDITRYFMSIPEAAQLVMQAGLMGKGGEIFVLNMGEPVRIVDMAKDMVKLSGYKDDEIAIEFVGLRPGEKLYEELLANYETTVATSHSKIRISKARVVNEKWVVDLLLWIETVKDKDESTIKRELKDWVEEYTPNSCTS